MATVSLQDSLGNVIFILGGHVPDLESIMWK